MEIRRRPRTSPAGGQQQYLQRNAGVDLSPLAEGLGAISTTLNEARRTSQALDLQQRVLQETNRLQAQLEERKRDPEFGMTDFADRMDREHASYIDTLLTEYADYDRDLVDQFAGNLAQLRSGLFENAFEHQIGTFSALAISNAKTMVDDGTRQVQLNPDNFIETLDTVEDYLDRNPYLTEAERISYREDALQSLRMTASASLVMQDPNRVIAELDPEGRFAAQQSGRARPAVTAEDVETVRAAYGDNVEAFDRWLAGVDVAETPAAVDRQTVLARAWADKRVGRGEFEAAIALQEGEDAEQHAALVERTRALFAANGVEIVEEYSPEEVTPATAALAALTGPERLQILEQAQQALQVSRTQDRAAMRLRIDNIKAEALANGGQISGTIPTQEEVIATFGPVEGPPVFAEVQSTITAAGYMSRWATTPETTMRSQLARLMPAPGSETFAAQMQVYRAAETAMNQILSRRQEDPAQYIMENFPAAQSALQRGDLPAFYQQVREGQRALGIADGNILLLPQSVISAERERYQTLTGQGRMGVLNSWSVGMTEDEFSNLVNQFAGTVIAEDAGIYQYMKTWPGSRALLPEIFAGREIIQRDPARQPTQVSINTAFRDVFERAIGELNPEFSNSVSQAAVALYVRNNGGYDVTADRDLYIRSLRQVLGGTGAPDTGWADIGKGVNDLTILPPRVNSSQFVRFTENITDTDLQRWSMTGNPPTDRRGRPVSAADIIEAGTFVLAAPGIYMIKLDDDRFLMDNGDPYFIQLDRDRVNSRQAPIATRPLGELSRTRRPVPQQPFVRF